MRPALVAALIVTHKKSREFRLAGFLFPIV